jgi:hypothetical protein
VHDERDVVRVRHCMHQVVDALVRELRPHSREQHSLCHINPPTPPRGRPTAPTGCCCQRGAGAGRLCFLLPVDIAKAFDCIDMGVLKQASLSQFQGQPVAPFSLS